MQQEPWELLKVLSWTKEYLASKGVENARLEAEWLLCATTGLDRVGLYLNFEKPLNDSELADYRSKVTRRGRREPLQHILGSQEFCGLDFGVSCDVLIPRHDTAVLVSEAVTKVPDADTALDIGTGSGCIAVVLALQLPQAAVTATDISEMALAVAIRNARQHGAPVEFLHGSLFSPLTGRHFDLIVSNPPYIPTADIDTLQPEVREFDPLIALDGGVDGLDFYRALIPAALCFLNPHGWLLVEVGVGQAADVMELFRKSGGYDEPHSVCDSNRIERVVGARLSSQKEMS
jgi:release factor glutamine methyltransferase